MICEKVLALRHYSDILRFRGHLPWGGLRLRDKSAFPPAVESRQWRAMAMRAADDSERAKGSRGVGGWGVHTEV